jgi:hypothetical protein
VAKNQYRDLRRHGAAVGEGGEGVVVVVDDGGEAVCARRNSGDSWTRQGHDYAAAVDAND